MSSDRKMDGVIGTLLPERVEPSAWRRACAGVLSSGGRFLAAYAVSSGGERLWRAVFESAGRTRVLSTEAGRRVDSIVDLAPAADWDEREAADLHGVRFAGRASTRPLAEHPAESAEWTVPVSGNGVHQVAVGPIHAGVIESGHFRFAVVGERILHLDAQLFHKHRGLERAAQGEPLTEAIRYAGRACGACAVANSIAYALAAEELLGLETTAAIRRARTALAELERLYNHVNDLAAICAGVGFSSGNTALLAIKERLLRINLSLSGHRYLFGSVKVGRSELELSADGAAKLRAELARIALDLAEVWRQIRFTGSVRERLDGVGVVSRDLAERLGAVGPAARASGVVRDARVQAHGLHYPQFAPARLDLTRGDVDARARIRAIELEASFAILAGLLEEPLAAETAVADGEPGPALAVARVESPRGETFCALERQGAGLARMRLRTGSYANWPVLAAACEGELLPDFPLINKSFELCYACVDR